MLTQRILLLLTSTVLLAPLSCAETIINEMDCACCLGVEEDVKPADTGSTPGEIAQTDADPVVERWVGQACAENDECELKQCITTELLKTFGVENEDIVIPNGLCSLLLCPDDEACGPDALCFNSKPFSGADMSFCLPKCTKMAQCRWQEGYTCQDVPLEPDNPDAGTADVCLPDSLVVAIECDDMHCEGLEPGEGTCDELADCKWKEDYSCYIEEGDEKGICVPDKTVVTIECEDGSCPLPDDQSAEGGE